jgi:tripartite-type tricarboxylate transporter receptor subunit TctC
MEHGWWRGGVMFGFRFAPRWLAVVAIVVCGSIGTPDQLHAQSFPTRVVRAVVPFAPGASTDHVARLLGQKLSQAWGQQVVVENRGGAGGGLGADMVAKAEPDGYTQLVTNQGSILNVLLRKDVTYAIEDLAPVIEFGYSPLIIVANPQFPPNNIKELIAYAKASPGKVLIGSSGTNSNVHIALEVLKSVAGVDVTHVPYRGTGPSLNDVVAGTINGAYTTTISAEGLIKSNKVKVLGVAGPRRSDVIPDISTYAEQGIANADANVSIGLFVPAKTPQSIIGKVNRDANQALQSPDVRARFAQWGLELAGGAPDAYAASIKAEVRRIDALVKAKALQVE